MFLIDTAAGRIVSDDEVKEQLAGAEPYGEWLHAGLLDLKTLPDRARVQPNHESVVRRQVAFGYTEEDLRILLTPPMAASGTEPPGSMGTDTPAAVLSQRSKLLYDYFVELFAQVTNPPPLDAIREEVVTSMSRVMGPEQNLLEPTAASCRQIVLRWPVLDNDELNKIVHINDDGEQPGLRTAVLRALYDVERGGDGLAEALEDLRLRACEAIAKGARTLVLSDRDSDHTRPPRFPRCSPCRRFTTIWFAPRNAPRWLSSSKVVTPARSTTSRCSSASAPPRSTRTWPSSPSRT